MLGYYGCLVTIANERRGGREGREKGRTGRKKGGRKPSREGGKRDTTGMGYLNVFRSLFRRINK